MINILRDEKGKFIKGSHCSPKTEFKKGSHVKTEFQKGHITWNKGRIGVYSEEVIERMSKSHMGHVPWNKGIPISEEQKRKLIQANKGNTYRLGAKLSEETKGKISEALKGRYGSDNPNWKGGITSLRHLIRTNFRYRQWRDDIFTRDNFTCQECGQIGGRLRAHHIKSFSSILQYYEITTLEEALECEELWSINNGITLCKKCHKKIHKGVTINEYIG